MCASCNRPVRVGHEKHGDRHVRVCQRCGATLEK
jgi:DNA-directed RNA polymerase subunit RPC12/RpoP